MTSVLTGPGQLHEISTSSFLLVWYGRNSLIQKGAWTVSSVKESPAMADSWEYLRVDIMDDELIVSLPYTSYSVTYYKRENSPQLVAKNIPMTDDIRTPVKLSDFLSHASIANEKGARTRMACVAVVTREKEVPGRSRRPVSYRG